MLDPDIIRVMGDSESRLGLVGALRSLCNLGEGRRFCTACAGGLVGTLGRSGEVSSSVGGAAGNLKLLENELDALRVVMLGMFGVLGVVVIPGRLRPGRAGMANSPELSWTAAGDDIPPANGDGWVADRCPGEFAATLSAMKLGHLHCAGCTWIRRIGPARHNL